MHVVLFRNSGYVLGGGGGERIMRCVFLECRRVALASYSLNAAAPFPPQVIVGRHEIKLPRLRRILTSTKSTCCMPSTFEDGGEEDDDILVVVTVVVVVMVVRGCRTAVVLDDG